MIHHKKRRVLSKPAATLTPVVSPPHTSPHSRSSVPLTSTLPSTTSSSSSLHTVNMHDASYSSSMATIKAHDGNKIAPVLSVGTLSPSVVLEWQSRARVFFTRQKIPVEEQVSEILDCFRDQRIIGWIANNRPILVGNTYNFTSFMKKFRELFLDPDWEYDIVRSVLNAKMASNELFSSYADSADRIITGNNLLRGTESCLDNAGLKNTLAMNMSEGLTMHLRCIPEVERNRLQALEFELWIPAISRIDNALNGQKRQMREMAEAYSTNVAVLTTNKHSPIPITTTVPSHLELMLRLDVYKIITTTTTTNHHLFREYPHTRQDLTVVNVVAQH